MSHIKKYLIAGVLVWLPIVVTLMVVNFLIGFFDRSLLLLPAHLHPEELLGFYIPGFGVILSFFLILITGILVANFFGRYIYNLWEKFLAKIPLVRSIYKAVKQISESIFGSNGQTFKKAFLIQYPRKGLWTLAFQTSKNQGEAQHKTQLPDVINLFVPTTPNPTSGFFIMTSIHDLVELDMSVDQALKMVISGGVVVPPWQETDKQKTIKQQTTIADKEGQK